MNTTDSEYERFLAIAQRSGASVTQLFKKLVKEEGINPQVALWTAKELDPDLQRMLEQRKRDVKKFCVT